MVGSRFCSRRWLFTLQSQGHEMSVLMRLKTDAQLASDFDRMLAEMRRANRVNPRTTATVGFAKSIGKKLFVITNEMQRRAGGKLAAIGVSDSVIAEVSAVTGSVSDAVNTATNKVLFGLVLVGFILFQYNKKWALQRLCTVN